MQDRETERDKEAEKRQRDKEEVRPENIHFVCPVSLSHKKGHEKKEKESEREEQFADYLHSDFTILNIKSFWAFNIQYLEGRMNSFGGPHAARGP